MGGMGERNSTGQTPAAARYRRPWQPAPEGAWSVRLRFLGSGLALALCWWLGVRALHDRVSFGWAVALQARVQAAAAPLQGLAQAASSQTPPGSARGVSVAQALPVAPTATPVRTAPTPAALVQAPTVAPALVLVVTATPVAVATPTAAVQRVGDDATPVATTTRGAAKTASPTREAATPLPETTVSGPHTIYIVQSGDTLFRIARRYGLSTTELAAFNHLPPPYRLIQGARLYIPAT